MRTRLERLFVDHAALAADNRRRRRMADRAAARSAIAAEPAAYVDEERGTWKAWQALRNQRDGRPGGPRRRAADRAESDYDTARQALTGAHAVL